MTLPAPLLRGLALAGFMGVFGATLAWSSELTAPQIEENAREDRRKLLREVIPDSLHDAPLDQETVAVKLGAQSVEYLLGRKAGELTAVAFQVESSGYSGVIKALVGVQPDGTILGVRVISHSETPGLGDRVEATKSDWIHGFDGKSLVDPDEAQWLVKKDGGAFDALSGATITPRAVVLGVKNGLLDFQKAQPQLVQAAQHLPAKAKEQQ